MSINKTEKTGFLKSYQGFQPQIYSRNPVFDPDARCQPHTSTAVKSKVKSFWLMLPGLKSSNPTNDDVDGLKNQMYIV